MKVPTLYIVSAALGISAALLAWKGLRSDEAIPSIEVSARLRSEKLGFSSVGDLKTIGALLDTYRITTLDASERTLLCRYLAMENDAKWMAVAVLGRLNGEELQRAFISEARMVAAKHPDHLLVREVLERWMIQGGRGVVVDLAKDSDREVAGLARSVLAKEPQS